MTESPDFSESSSAAASHGLDSREAASQVKGRDLHRPEVHAALVRYWKRNLLIMRSLLVVWAVVGLGCGVLFADWLNVYKVGGFPLGFWFAQQGSIVIFVLLILIYCLMLNRLDRQHHEELQRINEKSDSTRRTRSKQ